MNAKDYQKTDTLENTFNRNVEQLKETKLSLAKRRGIFTVNAYSTKN